MVLMSLTKALNFSEQDILILPIQIEDMHNEMEHATDYLKNRLAEQQNKSELNKMQVCATFVL